jgi:hypothetical protein
MPCTGDSILCLLSFVPAAGYGLGGNQARVQGDEDPKHPQEIALPRIEMDLVENNPTENEHHGYSVPEPNGKLPSWFYQNQQQADKEKRINPAAEQNRKILERRLLQQLSALPPGYYEGKGRNFIA